MKSVGPLNRSCLKRMGAKSSNRSWGRPLPTIPRCLSTCTTTRQRQPSTSSQQLSRGLPPNTFSMPSTNRIIICAADGGKTTTIVNEACEESGSRCPPITYTRNNEQEINRKFYNVGPMLPPHVEVMSWFTFLLRELARPYRPVLHT